MISGPELCGCGYEATGNAAKSEWLSCGQYSGVTENTKEFNAQIPKTRGTLKFLHLDRIFSHLGGGAALTQVISAGIL